METVQSFCEVSLLFLENRYWRIVKIKTPSKKLCSQKRKGMNVSKIPIHIPSRIKEIFK